MNQECKDWCCANADVKPEQCPCPEAPCEPDKPNYTREKPDCQCKCRRPLYPQGAADGPCEACRAADNKYPCNGVCIQCPQDKVPDAMKNCDCVFANCRDPVTGNPDPCKVRDAAGNCVDKCPAGAPCNNGTCVCPDRCEAYDDNTKACKKTAFAQNCFDNAPTINAVLNGVCTCVCMNNRAVPVPPEGCGDQGPLGPFAPSGGSGGSGSGDGGSGDGGGTSSGSSNPCGANASLDKDGQCYCNYPSAILVGTSCACSPGYVFGGDGVTCCDPFNTPGGCDGIGATRIEIIEDFSSMCDGVDCPPGQSCFQTVFGAECR